MRIVPTNPLLTIDSVMSENEKILFNLFYLIAECKDSFWVTDEKSYIIGQINERLAMWVWMQENVSEEACAGIEEAIEERLESNPKLKITADEARIRPVLGRIARRRKVSYSSMVPMVVYRCDQMINNKKSDGKMILTTGEHKKVLEKFITGTACSHGYDLAQNRRIYQDQYCIYRFGKAGQGVCRHAGWGTDTVST